MVDAKREQPEEKLKFKLNHDNREAWEVFCTGEIEDIESRDEGLLEIILRDSGYDEANLEILTNY